MVHVGDGRIIAADRFLLPPNIHFHADAGSIVDAEFRNVVPITFDLFGQHHLVVRLVPRVIASRCNERHVRPYKADAQPEVIPRDKLEPKTLGGKSVYSK